MISVTKVFEFSASHFLPNYDGKCGNWHGHNYILEVTVAGPLHNGMVVDFGDLKTAVNAVLDQHYDHKHLNDHIHNPTAENMLNQLAEDIGYELAVRDLPCIRRMKLWETSTSYAEVEIE